MSALYYSSFLSSLGKVYAATTTKGLCRLTIDVDNKIDDFARYLQKQYQLHTAPAEEKHDYLRQQLEAYLKGKLKEFNLSVDLIEGTPFQRDVWEETSKISYGKIVTYKQIANRINRPKAFRAVGQALGANPIAIIIPCHRVIASNGSLGGFGLGLPVKEHLLNLEGAM